MRRMLLVLMLIGCTFSGCTMLEYLAPHQLWKLNRQAPLGNGDDGYFSIPAPAPSSGATESLLELGN